MYFQDRIYFITIIVLLLFAFTLNVNALSTADVTSYFKLNEIIGTTVTDSKGSNDGYNSFATINQPGKIGTAYDFNYLQRVILSNESNFDFLTANAGNWTITFWEKPSNLAKSGDNVVWSKLLTNNGFYLMERGADANKLRLIMQSSAGNATEYLATTTTPTSGTWSFIVIRSTAGVINIKVNDTNQAFTVTPSGTGFVGVNVATPFHINTTDSNVNGFQGTLDEFGIFNKALSDLELTQLYNSGTGLTYPFTSPATNAITFNVIDENTGLPLQDANVTLDSNSQLTNAFGIIQFDLNYLTTTNQTFITSISKTGYSTRYYTIDLNKNYTGTINLALLPSTQSVSTEFQFFNPTATTILSDSYVTVTQLYRATYTERLKTDSTGKVTFQLNTADGNYSFNINYGGTIYDYNAISTTIYAPRDESTQILTSATWNLTVTGITAATYNNLGATANKILLLYANTYSSYYLRIDSNSIVPIYYPKNYVIKILGYPATYSLQPYLVSSSQGYITTIKTLTTNGLNPVPNINIKIYRILPATGRTLVDEELTNSSGDAITSMITNQLYEFDIYQNNVKIATLNQTGQIGSGYTIYIYINDTSYTPSGLNAGSFTVNYYPIGSMLHSYDYNLIQTINLLDFNSNITVSSIKINVVNVNSNGVDGNNVLLYTLITTSPTLPFVNNIDINGIAKTVDGNKYDSNSFLRIDINITTNSGVFIVPSYIYSPYNEKNLVQSLGLDLRPLFGCTATNNALIPCPSLLLFALFISICISVAVAVSMGYVSMSSIGILFIFLIGVFTYIAWIPMLLFGIMAAGTFGLMIAEGGRRI